MSRRQRLVGSFAAFLLVATIAGCGGSSGGSGVSPLAASGTVYATTSTNDLVTFASVAPSTILTSVPITGLALGETVTGLDLRTGLGELIALGSTGRLYRLDPATAVATGFSATPFTVLTGAAFGFDIDPDADQIRVVDDADENVRADAATGASLGSDAPLAYAASDPNFGSNPTVTALAYTADSAGAATATAYGIDAGLSNLVRLGGLGGTPAPSTGVLATVGSLGASVSGPVTFDIAGGGGRAFATFGIPGSRFYRIDLSTGMATLVGNVGAAPTIVTGLAVVSEPAPTLLVLDTAGVLRTVRADAPGTVLSSVAVTGLIAVGETLVGIDVRPATGQLYGVSSTSRLYRIDRTTGAATVVGAPGAFTLSGSAFGLDFNPVVDRLRIVSDLDQNLRINPNDGTLAGTDTVLQYAALDANAGQNPGVVASAYTNSAPGATTTTLYGIDATLDVLVVQSPPNNGTLNTVGALGVDTSGLSAFEIQASTGSAFAALTAPAASSSVLYRVSLGTGAATFVGTIGGGAAIVGLSVLSEDTTTILVVDASNVLYRVRGDDPSTPLAPGVAVSGLAVGENVLGLDVRPASGEVFLLGSTSRLYTLDPATGVATVVGSPGAFTLSGTTFGFDFDPVADRIRVTSDADQNLRLHPNGTLESADAALAYAAADANFGANPDIVASAYVGVAGASTTTLYGLDATLGVLVTQGPPNAGTLHTVGSLGVSLIPGLSVGLDVDPSGGRSYASGTVVSEVSARLFVANLATGLLTTVGLLPGASPIRGIAVLR